MSKQTISLLMLGVFICVTQNSLAAVTAEEAKQLGNTLTEFGAEKSGNKDGSIPAYSGGLDKVTGYDPKSNTTYVDPYNSEKPLYSVDSKNVEQYDSFLTKGTKALIKNYPGYRVDVYPSHRSTRYQSYVLKNTIKNATTAKLGGPVEGDNLEGADAKGLPYAGIPFPIPKTGAEVMWNHFMHYGAAISHSLAQGFLIDTAGGVTNLPTVETFHVHPWYDKADKLRGQTFDAMMGFKATLTSPPTSAGIVFLPFYTPKGEEGGQKVWFYTPGQRRVRMAPEFAYDVPIASYGGVMFWDEIYGYVGRLDRFDYKLVGKKEMLIPYNVFKLTNTSPTKDIVGQKFVNPDVVRWEKHRVWVVEATRKTNARHVYSRRTFYVDEDSWSIVTSEHYDNAGNIYRVTQNDIFPTYDVGGTNNQTWTTYDLIKGNYFVINVGRQDSGNYLKSYDTSEGLQLSLTAQSVAASGVR